MDAYNDEHFLSSYLRLRENPNYNDLLETPAALSLLPDVKGRNILDIGCGFGASSAYFADAGATSVLAIDASERMISKAISDNSRENIEYEVMRAEDLHTDRKFDIVWSSLVFHYIEDFGSLLKTIHDHLVPGGILIFSQEHPLTTSDYSGHYTEDNDGNWNGYRFSSYGREGERRSLWFDTEVVTYHRTFSTIITSLHDNGFVVEKVLEPLPSEPAISIIPRMKREIHKPSFLVIKARI